MPRRLTAALVCLLAAQAGAYVHPGPDETKAAEELARIKASLPSKVGACHRVPEEPGFPSYRRFGGGQLCSTTEAGEAVLQYLDQARETRQELARIHRQESMLRSTVSMISSQRDLDSIQERWMAIVDEKAFAAMSNRHRALYRLVTESGWARETAGGRHEYAVELGRDFVKR